MSRCSPHCEAQFWPGAGVIRQERHTGDRLVRHDGADGPGRHLRADEVGEADQAAGGDEVGQRGLELRD